MIRVMVIGALLCVSSVQADTGTLYRCVDSQGAISYVNKPVSGAQCRVFSQYRPDYAPPPSPPPVSPPPAVTPVRHSDSDSPPPPTTSTPPPVVTSTPTPPVEAPKRRVRGQVYSYMKDGIRHFSSVRPDNGADVEGMRTIHYELMDRCHACGAGGNFNTARLNVEAYKDEIASASRQYGVEEAIIRAVIHAESAFKPNALSRAGAQGLMQLMPATARRFGVTDPWNPAQNIRGGVEYLAWLLRRFNGNLSLAAAGYNAGENAVDRHGGIPPYSETQFYVPHVVKLAERYRTELTVAKE